MNILLFVMLFFLPSKSSVNTKSW